MKAIRISQFKNEFEFLSNFYISPFVWNGYCWNTVEHAYQSAKAKFSNDKWLIRTAKTPAIAKKLGRKVNLRGDWEQVKVSIMTELVWLKFEYNPTLRDMLLNTDSAELIEGNYWHDNFWGDCFCPKCKEGKGKNVLGFILMKVRDGILLEESPQLEMTKEQKLRETVFLYIEAKKRLTLCMGQHLRQVCSKCNEYASCFVYNEYVQTWMNLQNSYYIEKEVD